MPAAVGAPPPQIKLQQAALYQQMLQEVGIHACLPGFDGDLRAATQLYRSFGTSAGAYADLLV